MKLLCQVCAAPFYACAAVLLFIGTALMGIAVTVSGKEWPEDQPERP